MTLAGALAVLLGSMAGGLVYVLLPAPRECGERGVVTMRIVILAFVVATLAVAALTYFLGRLQ